MEQKNIIKILVIFLALGAAYYLISLNNPSGKLKVVTNFEECVADGNPVMESYPRQCRYGEKTFVEDIVGLPPLTDNNTTPPRGDDGVMCTADAKICPDGSGVGRVGPNCEFAPCPGN